MTLNLLPSSAHYMHVYVPVSVWYCSCCYMPMLAHRTAILPYRLLLVVLASIHTVYMYISEGIITACHLTFAGPKGQMSDRNLVWSDIVANEIIRTGLNVWQFLDWSGIMSDHFRKVIIPTDISTLMYSSL